MQSRFEKQRELESLIGKVGGLEMIQIEYRALTGKPVGQSENPEGRTFGSMIKAIIDLRFPKDETS